MISGPDYIQWYPTLRCNRACDFCFNRSLSPLPDMTAADFTAMLCTLDRAGVRTLDIMGGEPTLHVDIVAFVREAASSGFSINISSNGSNPGVLSELMDAGEAVTVGISINDGETLVRLRDFIQEHRPVVKSLFSRNTDHDMIGDILSLQPKKFYLIYRDALHQRELGDTVPFPEFATTIENSFPSAQVGTVFCSGFLPDRSSLPELAAVRCPAGTTKLGVLPDGSVYPCNLFFGMKDFFLGNLLRSPFEHILQHQALACFRSFAGNPCTQAVCRFHAQCHGGCPAQSLLLAGNLSAPDPRCNPC